MFNELVKDLLQSRDQVDAEMRDELLGKASDFDTSNAEMYIDSLRDDLALPSGNPPSLENAFDHSELLQTLAGMEKADADQIAYGTALPTMVLGDIEIEFLLPLGKHVRVARERLDACKTTEQRRDLDCLLYKSAGLNPASYGL